MKFTVTLIAALDVYQTVEVEADTAEDAEARAWENLDHNHYAWQKSADLVNGDSIEVNEVDAAEEDSEPTVTCRTNGGYVERQYSLSLVGEGVNQIDPELLPGERLIRCLDGTFLIVQVRQ